MATLTRDKKLRIDANKIYVAWQSFAVDQYVFQRGDRLRGDHPAVKRMREAAFVEDGTPESEWPNVFDAAVEMSEKTAKEAAPPPREVHRIDPATPLRRLLFCTRAIVMSTAGSCREGKIVRDDDPLVAAAPDAFEPLDRHLG